MSLYNPKCWSSCDMIFSSGNLPPAPILYHTQAHTYAHTLSMKNRHNKKFPGIFLAPCLIQQRNNNMEHSISLNRHLHTLKQMGKMNLITSTFSLCQRCLFLQSVFTSFQSIFWITWQIPGKLFYASKAMLWVCHLSHDLPLFILIFLCHAFKLLNSLPSTILRQ